MVYQDGDSFPLPSPSSREADTWDRFDKNKDYRKLNTTKPHFSHPNHVTIHNNKVYITRYKQEDVLVYEKKGKYIGNIKLGNGIPHDGSIFKSEFIYTTVTGKIIKVDISKEKINKIIDLNKFAKEVIKHITNKAISVDSKMLHDVSVISANNDIELGSMIANAFQSAGENGIVTMETSPNNDTYTENVNGTKIGSTCKAPHFYTNKEKELCELENPLIFMSASDIPNVRKIQDILEFAIKSNRAVLLIAPLETQPLTALAMNKVKGNIKVNVIDPPSFGLKRKDVLEDLALLVGAKVFDESLGDSIDAITPDMLGSADKAVSDKEGTVLVVSEKSKEVQERIEYLKTALEKEEHNVMSKHLTDRIALLSGGVSVILVGAATEVELKEKQDRVDDAIHAVRAAKKEGILPGGGTALAHAAIADWEMILNGGELKGVDILKDALTAPYTKILTNAGIEPHSKTLSVWGEGIDVTCGCKKKLIKVGIIDPLLVTKTALQNAISVSTTILSTDCVISNVREE